MDRWGVHGRGMALFSVREQRRVGPRRRFGAAQGHCGRRRRRHDASSPSAPTSPHGRRSSATRTGRSQRRPRPAQHRAPRRGVRAASTRASRSTSARPPRSSPRCTRLARDVTRLARTCCSATISTPRGLAAPGGRVGRRRAHGGRRVASAFPSRSARRTASWPASSRRSSPCSHSCSPSEEPDAEAHSRPTSTATAAASSIHHADLAAFRRELRARSTRSPSSTTCI